MKRIVIAKHLVKKYGQFTAVNGTSFEINEGECFAFLGPNGAGKTTTIRMIHCVSPVTSGELIVNGMKADINNRKIKQSIGVIPQEITLDSDLTTIENLMVFANFFDIPRVEAKKRVDELLAFVELESKKNNKISELSTGMKRRLLVARALINKPNIIIADEPTTGLDPQARHLVWQRLRELKKRGTTLILTTQYMEEAEQLADRLVVMFEGKILKEGGPSTLVSEEIGREVIEIRTPKEDDERITRALAGLYREHERVGDTLYLYCQNGHDAMKKIVELNVTNYLNRPASLEDVFLKLTGRGLIE